MRTERRIGWRAGMVAGMVVLAVVLAPARAEASDEFRLLTLTNQVRASSGLPTLTTDPQLSGVAQRWAATLAGRGVISHNSSLPDQVSGWKLLGENVGVGGTVDAIHAGWMASATHHRNVVDPSFTKVGFGVVRPDARIFVVQVFMLPKAQAAPPATVAATAAPAAATPSAPKATVSSAPPAPKPASAAPAPVPASSTSASAAAIVQALSAPPAGGELSPWLVHSLDRLRSLEPVKAG